SYCVTQAFCQFFLSIDTLISTSCPAHLSTLRVIFVNQLKRIFLVCYFSYRFQDAFTEGFLFKWTNYMTGWQQRWFTLKDGVLSYYRSQEEVECSDPLRFDLILGEQRFYLRALSRADRQRWVVALGSCKAGGAPPVELDELRLNGTLNGR
ncbi:hypothetical protein AHF37_12023, partial [Paragonimus kellicotti]